MRQIATAKCYEPQRDVLKAIEKKVKARHLGAAQANFVYWTVRGLVYQIRHA